MEREWHMADVTTYLVDPNGLSREGWCRLLEETRFNLLRDFSSVSELEEAIGADQEPQLVIIDVSALEDDVREQTRNLRSRLTKARIIYFGKHKAHDLVTAAFTCGIDGFLSRDISYEAMLQSLRLIMLGERIFPQGLIMDVMANSARTISNERLSVEGTNLSRRETEILRYVAAGMANKVIAARLEVAEPTVKVHLKNILQKLRVGNRTEAAIWALSRGIGHTGTPTGSKRKP